MLDGINGQHAECNRYAELHGHLGQAFGALASNVFEVRRTATNHSAQGDDGGEFVALGNLLRNQRDFERTRRANEGDVTFVHTVANQGINGTTHLAFDNKAVETVNYKCVATFGGNEGTFDGLQGHSVCLVLKSQNALACVL